MRFQKRVTLVLPALQPHNYRVIDPSGINLLESIKFTFIQVQIISMLVVVGQ